ncbi:MAG: hypothetical protein HY210_02200 [Candidatus Omnitrophica bacterium]|nr:hypothetical protein [Candidatus Omnitrophota bacterium]
MSMNVPVSSINSIASSIKTDPQVFRWFFYALSQTNIRSELVKNRDIRELYDGLEKNSKLYVLVFSALVLVLFTAYSAKIYFLTLSAPVLVYFLFKIDRRRKDTLSKISIPMLLSHFEEAALKQKTLYQICEYYAQKYSIASLVDFNLRADLFPHKIIIMFTRGCPANEGLF